jgi:hypothetical protein
MKTTHLLLTAVLALIAGQSAAAVLEVRFSDAVENGLIQYESFAPSTGRNLELSVNNTSEHDLLVTVEAGSRFTCEGPFQPRIISRLKQFFIKRDERRRIGLNARCGNADVGAAALGTPFVFDGFVHPECVDILNELAEERLDEHHLVQKIVWMYTNDRPITDLHPSEGDGGAYRHILSTVAQVQGPRFHDPGYRVEYEDQDDGLRFSGIPKQLSGHIPVALEADDPVSVQIINPAGEVLTVGAIHLPPFDSLTELGFTLDLKGFEQGTYEIQVVTATAAPEVVGQLPITL